MVARKGSEGEGVLGGLRNVYTAVAALALEPDAAMYAQPIEQLRQVVLKVTEAVTQAKSQQAAQMQAQQRQQATNGLMGGPQQPSPGGGPQPGQPGGPPSQGSPGLAMPNPDELRRLLASQGQGG